MLAGRNVLTTTHQDEYRAEQEPPRSGIFFTAARPASAGSDRHHDAKATLDWLEHHLARRYEGEETLARLARLNDEY